MPLKFSLKANPISTELTVALLSWCSCNGLLPRFHSDVIPNQLYGLFLGTLSSHVCSSNAIPASIHTQAKMHLQNAVPCFSGYVYASLHLEVFSPLLSLSG